MGHRLSRPSPSSGIARKACCRPMNLKKLIAQFMKFGVVGVIAFFIDFGVMVFLT